jgi:hypothetical protein
MERILLKILRKVVQLITTFNSKLPSILEIDLQNMQGKGSGGVVLKLKQKLHLISCPGVA